MEENTVGNFLDDMETIIHQINSGYKTAERVGDNLSEKTIRKAYENMHEATRMEDAVQSVLNIHRIFWVIMIMATIAIWYFF